MLPSRRHLSRDVHAYFNKTMQKHILHTLQSPGCGGRGYGYLTGLPAVPTCLQIENVWRILKRKMRQRRPRMLPTLRLVCRKNGTKLHLKHFITWWSSVPKTSFKCCEKEWQHYKVVNALLTQLFLECVAGLNDRKGCIFTKWHEVTRQNMKYFVFYCLQKKKKDLILSCSLYWSFILCPDS